MVIMADDGDLDLSLQEDSDGDGYISCFQVLLALKNIIPPELLSDEEEIYVYRVHFYSRANTFTLFSNSDISQTNL